MQNLRIISDNALDRALTFGATSTNPIYPASNMLNDDKSSTWRTGGGTYTNLTATWATAELISAIVFPICNFTSNATGQVIVSTEFSKINLVLYSQQFDAAPWNKGAGTVTADSVLAPDGNTTADRFVSSGADGYLSQIVAVTADFYTFSIWMKAPTPRTINIYLNGGATQVACAVTTSWQRFSSTSPITTGSATVQVGGGGSMPSGTEVHVWGAQLEAGAMSSNYPTTGAAAVRPTGYIDNWQSYNYNSGGVLLCPAPSIKLRGFTAAQALGAYAYGGGACARIWIPEIAATGIRVYLDNPTGNPQGYLEISRAIIGPYWSPTYNASAASWTPVDTTAQGRTDAGGQIADAGYIYKRVSIDLSMMPASDRTSCARLLRNSRAYPIFLSLFPESDDLELERDNSVYGRRTADSDIAIENSIFYGTKITVEEI